MEFRNPLIYESGKSYLDSRGNKVTIQKVSLDTSTNQIIFRVKIKSPTGNSMTTDVRGVDEFLASMSGE